MNDKVLLKVDEAAAALGVGRSFIYALLLRKEIDSVALGRARRIPRQALDRYIERLRAEQSEAPF